MDPDMPPVAPVEKFSPAHPAELRGAAARDEPALDESGERTQPKVVREFFRRAPQHACKLVRNIDTELHGPQRTAAEGNAPTFPPFGCIVHVIRFFMRRQAPVDPSATGGYNVLHAFQRAGRLGAC